ncbi:hypothetical protein [Acidocella aminolytica]|uniref:Uncharacterized protein n=1 Tax=Acidocella aminolytica 101 = DSM 11237 TaxID=1120923 RepID=A0A0D6PLU6_9PROT|nr:hypothetical protein [Acidocella aminolytica]GAN81744.1 hypothetical protein Aam_115_001 [Acidocella aminolytica 101 = DSM 11237]GBQ38957.1 hypothetical protein AA11237_1930 [Acidocella aminolytica 101 = DSM 11237]SHF64923.1 hypothetical protein SAMN02746095_03960 [Acidocella aminolytica 101 = DSM 11237]
MPDERTQWIEALKELEANKKAYAESNNSRDLDKVYDAFYMLDLQGLIDFLETV